MSVFGGPWKSDVIMSYAGLHPPYHIVRLFGGMANADAPHAAVVCAACRSLGLDVGVRDQAVCDANKPRHDARTRQRPTEGILKYRRSASMKLG